MTSNVFQINDRAAHDEVVSQSKEHPTVINVSNSSLPICKKFTLDYSSLAERWQPKGIKFAQLEFSRDTSMLFKFSPNQLPVTVLRVGDRWCKTVMGANIKGLEDALGELLRESNRS
ncbi:hypothetical protein M409DRAFT_27781 [Zasmidium cellare ATCC 36951]|uniref:Thioredoxin domain-containing protein n=1 Tax=Zasmidium cellare ATCC 36951 TaxID=1080233 RepID=A0A6A6C3N6_ZASCE|nr:uncharacterized protein M409DRAFT_27781 [Zasmidium cellare ATCC 36951]KAF2161724.1 hypothetical protein M409DRAFT_27781 [Zasmidium cellare ATCC 36951]